MIKHLPIIIVLLPLVAGQLCMLAARILKKADRWLIQLTLLVTAVLTVIQLIQVINDGPIHYYFGNYKAPIGVEFYIDTVNGLVLVMVAVIGLITFLLSNEYDFARNRFVSGGFNTVLVLLITGLLGMTSTGDAFNLYVFLEITSLSCYCMVAIGSNKGVIAAFRYMLVGTVAATLYLLGVGVLYSATGTLNMQDMAQILDKGGYDQVMMLAMCCFIPAFGIKMALFPFHGWQPSAYTHAEASVRPLIAGVMGKIPALALFRYLFCVFGPDFKYFRVFLTILGVLSVCAMLYGSIRAIGQKNFRKVLSYSSVAQIGYISLGFAIGTPVALCGAFLHMLGHAFMKSGLFIVVGAIKYRFGRVWVEDLGRIYKKMPLTGALLVVASLSMVGIPPTAGFFSKWYIGTAAAATHDWIYLGILVVSSLLNAVYFFRLIERVFVQEDKGLKEVVERKHTEGSAYVVIPIVVCIIAILGIGICNVKLFDILMLTLGEVGL